MGEQESIWNSDNIEHILLFEIKTSFISNMKSWNLEGAYWDLRLLRMEFDAKLSDTEQKKIETDTKELEDARLTLINSKNNSSKSGDFFLKLEGFYLLLNRLMKEHGLYFRGNLDPAKAALRR